MQPLYDSEQRQQLGIVCNHASAIWGFTLQKLAVDRYKAHVTVYNVPCRVLLSPNRLMNLNVHHEQRGTYMVRSEGDGTYKVQALANAAGSALAVLQALQVCAP